MNEVNVGFNLQSCNTCPFKAPRPIEISINLNADSFDSPDAIDKLMCELAEHLEEAVASVRAI